MSYSSPSDILARYDSRSLGDLCSDSGTRLTPTQLLTDTNLQAALDDASGLVNSAAVYGQRYTPAELAALTDVDLALLKRLVCDLAFAYLVGRRGNDPEAYQSTKQAQDMLERIKQGQRLFAVPGEIAAGLEDINFPSIVDYTTINLLRDATLNRYYPTRRQQTKAP